MQPTLGALDYGLNFILRRIYIRPSILIKISFVRHLF